MTRFDCGGFGGRVHQNYLAAMGGARIDADAGAAALEQLAVEERAGEGLEHRDDGGLGPGVERCPEAQEIILHHAQIVLRQGVPETGHALARLDDELVAERILLPGGAVRVPCVGRGADEHPVNVVERQKILPQREELDGGAHQALHGGDPAILRLRGAAFHTARHFQGLHQQGGEVLDAIAAHAPGPFPRVKPVAREAQKVMLPPGIADIAEDAGGFLRVRGEKQHAGARVRQQAAQEHGGGGARFPGRDGP